MAPAVSQPAGFLCETHLAAEYPIATVCQWIGCTVAIAARHCVQATDADFQRACAGAPQVAWYTQETASNPQNPDTENGCLSAVFAVMQPALNPPNGEDGIRTRGGAYHPSPV